MPIKGKIVLTKYVAMKHTGALVFFFIREMLNENKNGKKQSP
jgi:hypothetical protein